MVESDFCIGVFHSISEGIGAVLYFALKKTNNEFIAYDKPEAGCGFICKFKHASKESRTKLFTAMVENGYSWNAKKKIFKKVEKWQPKDGYFVRAGDCLICIKTVNGMGNCMIPTYFGLDEHRKLNFGETYGNNSNLSEMTNSEKQVLLDALAKDGKRWNAEKKQVEPIRWRAEKGGYYFAAILLNGEYMPYKIHDTYLKCDDDMYNSGDYFQTSEECQKYSDEFNRLLKERPL